MKRRQSEERFKHIDRSCLDEMPKNFVEGQRPHLPPAVGTSFPTDVNLDAQNEWLAHIAACRIGWH